MLEWKPNKGRQTLALSIRAFELLYGGSRGGGKTDAGIVWLIDDHYIDNPKFRGLVVRRNGDDLSDWIDRAEQKYIKFGARKVGKPVVFEFPSGAKIRTGHLKDKDAYTKYQGHEYHRMLIEEITQIPDEDRYNRLIASCRSTVPGLKPSIFATTNPTGKGHAWVKRRFVKGDGVPKSLTIWIPEQTGRTRVFIPATIFDNPVLIDNDPDYVKYLKGLPSALREAWLHGNWDVGAGQFFEEWKQEVHVCASFPIPDNWEKFICGDYGFAKPSAIYWNAIDPATRKVYTYRELYVTKHTGEMLAKSIVRMTPTDETIDWMVFDNSISSAGKEAGRSVLEQMDDVFLLNEWSVPIRMAKKGAGSRVNGWNLMRGYMKVKLDVDGKPETRWQVFKNCPQLIRVMPDQMYDERANYCEDLDTDGEDHAPDSIRYGLTAMDEPFEIKKRIPEPHMTKTLTNEELFYKINGQQ